MPWVTQAESVMTFNVWSHKKNPQEARENLRQATQMAKKIHNPNEKNEHMAMIGEAFIENRCYEEAQRTLGKLQLNTQFIPYCWKIWCKIEVAK